MITYLEHEPLAKYTSWRIGGPARVFANLASPEELIEARRVAREAGMPFFLLGGGTNVLARDEGWPGMVVRYRAQELRVAADGDSARAWIAAGAPMAGTVRRLARQGWAGLEWAEGLPGTIGGAVFGNAGCYGSDVAANLERAWLLNGEQVEEWPAARFDFSYRTSVLKIEKSSLTVEHPPSTGDERDLQSATFNRQPVPFDVHAGKIVLAAEFRVQRADPQALAEQMERTASIRRSKTPVGSSCGSVFKNPPGDSAGRLVEAAGLKRTRIGGAEIAEKHGNYIVNRGGASAADVLRLVEVARERVLKDFGVELELEVQVM